MNSITKLIGAVSLTAFASVAQQQLSSSAMLMAQTGRHPRRGLQVLFLKTS